MWQASFAKICRGCLSLTQATASSCKELELLRAVQQTKARLEELKLKLKELARLQVMQ